MSRILIYGEHWVGTQAWLLLQEFERRGHDMKWTPKFGPGAKVRFASNEESKRHEEKRTNEAQPRVQGQGRVGGDP